MLVYHTILFILWYSIVWYSVAQCMSDDLQLRDKQSQATRAEWWRKLEASQRSDEADVETRVVKRKMTIRTDDRMHRR